MTFLNSRNQRKTLKQAGKYFVDWDKKTRSKFQDDVKQFLRPFWKNDVVLEEMRMIGTLCTFDLVNMTKRIVVEVQGAQHNAFNPHFHRGNRMNFTAQIKRDLDKHAFCELNNLQLIEIYPKDKLSEQFFLELGVIL